MICIELAIQRIKNYFCEIEIARTTSPRNFRYTFSSRVGARARNLARTRVLIPRAVGELEIFARSHRASAHADYWREKFAHAQIRYSTPPFASAALSRRAEKANRAGSAARPSICK